MNNDLIKALRCIASDTPYDTCYEDYYNLTHHDGQRMSCSGVMDNSIPCPYHQNSYDVCFSDGACGEWLNKIADILENHHEKHKELKRFFELEIKHAQDNMKSWYNPYFNGVDVGGDKQIELNKAHIRFCEQILGMIRLED